MPQVPDSKDRYWDALRAAAADLRSAQGALHEAERLGEKYEFDDLRRIRECLRASGDAADSLASMLRDHDRPATCFPAGTAIATPSGTRRIETLRAGDRVTSRSQGTGEPTLRRVRRVASHPPTRLWRVALDDGRQILTTANHRLRCGDRWVRADQLHAGDRLHCISGRSSAGTLIAIRSVREAHIAAPVFNLLVEVDHAYFADGVLANSYALFHRTRGFVERQLIGPLRPLLERLRRKRTPLWTGRIGSAGTPGSILDPGS